MGIKILDGLYEVNGDDVIVTANVVVGESERYINSYYGSAPAYDTDVEEGEYSIKINFFEDVLTTLEYKAEDEVEKHYVCKPCKKAYDKFVDNKKLYRRFFRKDGSVRNYKTKDVVAFLEWLHSIYGDQFIFDKLQEDYDSSPSDDYDF